MRTASACAIGLLAAGTLLESAYRLIDPYPYHSPAEITHTMHGNLSAYHPRLGWSGVPSAKELLTTENASVWIEHNRFGFRDIEPEQRGDGRPALVFLGDSFTWGFEVAFEDMFVNIVRHRLAGFDVFNLAHRGYGTDQSLLAFQEWAEGRRPSLVVLMFTDTDIPNNNADFQYDKPKPRFVIDGSRLVLTNVPVPRAVKWDRPRIDANPPPQAWIAPLFASHWLHDMHFRLKQMRARRWTATKRSGAHWDFTVTERLLLELREDVRRRGARLAVVAIPSKTQFMPGYDDPPYQLQVEAACQRLGIDYLDLGPAFGRTLLRTYWRHGMHWNARGEAVAAAALVEYLSRSRGRGRSS